MSADVTRIYAGIHNKLVALERENASANQAEARAMVVYKGLSEALSAHVPPKPSLAAAADDTPAQITQRLEQLRDSEKVLRKADSTCRDERRRLTINSTYPPYVEWTRAFREALAKMTSQLLTSGIRGIDAVGEGMKAQSEARDEMLRSAHRILSDTQHNITDIEERLREQQSQAKKTGVRLTAATGSGCVLGTTALFVVPIIAVLAILGYYGVTDTSVQSSVVWGYGCKGSMATVLALTTVSTVGLTLLRIGLYFVDHGRRIRLQRQLASQKKALEAAEKRLKILYGS